MFVRQAVAWLRCKLTGHQWFYFKDFSLMYRDLPYYVRKRACTKCGSLQIGVPLVNDPKIIALSLENGDNIMEDPKSWHWVSRKKVAEIMGEAK